MNYYIKRKGFLEKYDVNINKEALEDLNDRIVSECSEIEHIEFDGYNIKEPLISSLLKDYNVNADSIMSYRKKADKSKGLYRYSFDVQRKPYLVNLINRVLEGDCTAISEIFCPDMTKERPTVADQIRIVSRDILLLDENDIAEIQIKTSQLKQLIRCEQLNREQKPVYPYYFEAQSLINLTMINRFDINVIRELSEFLEVDNSILLQISDINSLNEESIKKQKKVSL